MKFNPKTLTIIAIFLIVMLITTPLLVFSWENYEYTPYVDYSYDPYVEFYYEPYSDFYYEPEIVITPTITDTPTFEWTYDDFDPISDPYDTPYSHYPDITPDEYPREEPEEEEPEPTIIREKGLSIQITGTRMPDEINAGDQLELRVYLKNNGKEKLDNLKIVLVNQELSLRHAVGPMDLKRGDKASRILLLNFPYEVHPGYYYLRINVHANGINRVIYRDIYVK